MSSGDEMHEWEKKKLQDEWYIDAQITREEKQGPQMTRANHALADVARFVQADCGMEELKSLHYVGSAAVHIYLSPILQSVIQVTQTNTLAGTSEFVASVALEQLKKDAKAFYGHARKKTTRSGL